MVAAALLLSIVVTIIPCPITPRRSFESIRDIPKAHGYIRIHSIGARPLCGRIGEHHFGLGHSRARRRWYSSCTSNVRLAELLVIVVSWTLILILAAGCVRPSSLKLLPITPCVSCRPYQKQSFISWWLQKLRPAHCPAVEK